MAKGFGNMMKQAQKLQKQMLEMQEEIAKKTVEGTAGGGMVRVIANGNQDILDLKIDPEVVDPEDLELLEDLIVAAIANAKEKAKSLMEDEMGKIIPGGMGSLGIPGLG
ncbi:MAG TPA: YbaB/EbfC family nucleoid-associated protein [Anaerolineae bacterium]|nr:YbaB/EbfC family nucleoid-associated protein [Anaerolineae bacterium]